MSFWTYVLHCADGRYYVGYSDDLETRVAQHEAGEIPGYTHDRRPVTLVWSQEFVTRDEALNAERQIKGWSRAKKEALIRGDWEAVQMLSRKPFPRHAGSTGSTATQDERSDENPFVLSSGLSEAEDRVSKDPAIILVRPQLGQNIGKAARAMLNFGLTDLRLVAPRDGWPNPDAGPAASGADLVLERARLFDSVAEAVADCAHVYATTVRKRGVELPVVTPDSAAREIHAAPGRSAILFGPERSGLETDDVAVARTIITVPINPGFGSLNLAQAVILCAYEWSKGVALHSPPATDLDPPAAQSELDGLVEHLDELLERAGYFYPPDRAPTVRRTLRGVLTKPGWSAQEIRTLRGVLSTLDKRRPR